MTALAFTVLAVALVAGPLLLILTHHRQETPMTYDDPRLPSRWTHEGLADPVDVTVDLTMDKGTCTTDGRHEHVWRAGRRAVHAHVSGTGVVVMSEGALEELLVAAGFERAES